MAKSKGRLLAELLASDGKVKESKSALDISGGKLAPSDIPTLPNSKLENSSITIAGESTALGGSVSLNTGHITEHTNFKYFTNARSRGSISAASGGGHGSVSYNASTGALSVTGVSTEAIQDVVGAMFSSNTESGITVTYDDTDGTIDLSVTALNTGNVSEGSNLYHTTARARGSISATGSLSYNSTTGVMSFTMPAQNTGAITEGSNLYYTDARVQTYIGGNRSYGNITSTGNLSVATGVATGKFAVKSTSVHGSFDFYNNGTSYFNGSTTVDDHLAVTGSSAKLSVSATGSANLAKLHVGAVNSTSSSAIAQFGGFIRAAHYLILHDGAGSANTVQMRNTSGEVDFTQGEGSSSTPATRVNSLKIATTQVIDTSRNLTNIGTINSGAITSTGASQLFVGSDAVTVDNSGLTLTLTGTYSDGRYEHRFRKKDEGGGIPLYVDTTESTANSHTQIARFGSYSGNTDQFEVYGTMSSDGYRINNTTVIDANRNLTNIGTINATGTITGDITGSLSGTATQASNLTNHNTGGLSEGSNLYYTDARVGTYLSNNGYATQSTIVAAITDSAPATLNTLNELAAALGDDASFSTTVTNSIATKAPIANPSLTGNTSIAGNLMMASSTSHIELGSYLKLYGATANNAGAIAINANYGGAQTDSWTADYSGDVNAGMWLLRQASGGSGTMQVYQKKHGTSSGSHARSSFTKTAEFNVDGYLYGRNLRSEIFYDNDNTVYYTNPAGTSVMSAIQLGTNASPTLSDVAEYLNVQTSHGYFRVGPGNGSYNHIMTDRPQHYFNKKIVVDEGIVRSYDEDLQLDRAGSSTARLRITSGATISDQEFRAPIFYDSSNTDFYVDPVGNSKLYGTLSLGHTNSQSGTLVIYDTGNNALEIKGNGSNSFLFDMIGTGSTGSLKINDLNVGIGAAADSGHRLKVSTFGHNYLWIESTSGSNEAMTRYKNPTSNNWYTGIRNGTSNSLTNTSYHVYSSAFGATTGGWNASGQFFTANEGYALASFRAPYFYDSADTTYYADPANISNFTRLNLNYSQVWHETTQGGTPGSLHLDPNSATDHAGGAITFGASDTSNGTNAHAGIYVRSDGSYGTRMYLSTTDNYGLGSRTALYIDQAGVVASIRSRIVSASDMRATIFYDSADTTYYEDPASSRVLKGLSLLKAGHSSSHNEVLRIGRTDDAYRYHSLYATNNSTASILEFRIHDGGSSTSQTAALSVRQNLSSTGDRGTLIHTGTRLGFDESGTRSWTMKALGGGLNIYSGDGAGQLVSSVTGGFRASIFYDVNNTSYYTYPSSSSRVNQLRANKIQAGTISSLSSEGNLAVYDSGNPFISFHTGTARTAYIQELSGRFYFGEVPYTESEGSFRAPLFYDSSNAAYYLDPASNSVLSTVDIQRLDVNNSGFISFYGNGSEDHSIGSYLDDDIRINSYGSIYLSLDSNGNNDSSADFKIVKHAAGSSAWSNSQELLCLRGDNSNGDLTIGGSFGLSDQPYYAKLAIPGTEAAWGGSGTTTGAVVIDLPGTLANYDMLYLELDVFEYNGKGGTKIIIGTHNWNSGGNSGTGNQQWHNTDVRIIGRFDKEIYLGWRNDGTNNRRVIVLGNHTSSWSYGTVHVGKVSGATDFYTAAIDYTGNWNVTQSTNSSFYTKSPTTDWNNSDARALRVHRSVQGNRVYADTDMRAPHYYDLDNTAYYTNPASSSHMNAIYLADGLYHKDNSNTCIKFTPNEIDMDVGGIKALHADSSVLTINSNNANYDFKVKADNGDTLLHTDASANNVILGERVKINPGTSDYTSHSNVDQYILSLQDDYNTVGSHNLNFVNHNGNWTDGTTGGDTAYGLMWGYENSIRAGIHYDHRGVEKFDFYSTHGAFRFRTPASANGNISPIGSESSMPSRLTIDMGGAVTIPHSVRSDIYYDNANTAYFANPNGHSILNTVSIGTTNAPASGYGLRVQSIQMNGAGSIDYISQLHFNDNVRFYDEGNDQYLNYKWGDTGAGGIKFVDGDNNLQGYVYGHNENFGLLSPDGSWAVQTTNAKTMIHHRIDTPIMYDKDNTGFFVDPASSHSKIVGLNIHGGSNHNTNDGALYVNKTNDNDWLIKAEGTGSTTNYGITVRMPGAHSQAFHATNAGSEYYRVGTDMVLHNASIRSPIFYDSNNTAYYLDASSTGTSLNVAGNAIIPGYASIAGVELSSGVTRSLNNIPNNEWVTIASFAGGRKQDIIEIHDDESSRHNMLKMQVAWSFGQGSIQIINGVRHSARTINQVRMLYNTADRTYGTGKLQVYMTSWSTSRTLHIKQQAFASGNWGRATTPSTAETGLPSGYSVHEGTTLEANEDVNGTFGTTGRAVVGQGIDVFHGAPIKFHTTSGDGISTERGFIDAQEGGHLRIATSGGENIVFQDGGVGGTTNLTILGSGEMVKEATERFTIKSHSNGFDGGMRMYAQNNSTIFQIHPDNDGQMYCDRNWLFTASVRSPIFYDSNDTSYYVDPASTSISGKFRQTVIVGDGSQLNSNDGSWGARLNLTDQVHSKIEIGQDANSIKSHWYVHTGHDNSKFGTSTNHHLELQTSGTTRLKLDKDGGTTNTGNLVVTGDVQSNRYDDQGGTFLFKTGSGTGRTRHLNLADSSSDPASIAESDNPTGISWGTRSDNGAYYMLGLKGQYNNGLSTHSRLAIAWHTGVEIGANKAYGGTRFMADTPFLNTTELMSVGKGDTNVRVTNTIYAKTFTDIDDTSYYVDPNANSRIHRLNINGGVISSALQGIKVSSGTNGNTEMGSNTVAIAIGPSSTRTATANLFYGGIGFSGLYNYQGGTTYDGSHQAWIGAKYQDFPGSERSKVVIGVKSGTGNTGTGANIPQERFSVDYLGSAAATGDFRAPRFYDSNNTAYYTDPASTSIMNRVVTSGLYGIGHGSSTLPIWQYNAGNPGYGIAYTESSPDVLRFDVSGNLMSGTADLELRPNELRVNGTAVPVVSQVVRTDTGSVIGNNHSVTQRGQFTTGTSGQNNSAQASALSYSYGYQFGGAWTSPFPDLVLGYHTGVRIGGYFGYGGTRFYNDHPSRTSTILFSVGNGDAHVRATNNIYAYTSDIRLKENFRPIENAVDKVKAIGGFIFDWRKDMMEKHDFTPDQQQDDAGLIAQEVQKVMPAAIKRAPFDHDLTKPNQSKSGEDFLTVQYEKMVPLLVEAIKEQQKQIDKQQKQIDELNEKLENK